MGYNTSVVIMNDSLENIANDKSFGGRLSDAVRQRIDLRLPPIGVRAGNSLWAAAVIETHHADHLVPVLVGANTGRVVEEVQLRWNQNAELELLMMLAHKHNYKLVRESPRL